MPIMGISMEQYSTAASQWLDLKKIAKKPRPGGVCFFHIPPNSSFHFGVKVGLAESSTIHELEFM